MWFINLFMEPGVAHSVLLIAITIAFGLLLSRIKIGGVGLGVTWILFVGIIASHFGLVLDPTTSHFAKEFGLILFIYSIGLQVGPGFFSSFRKGGVTLNMCAAGLVLMGVLTAYIIHLITGEDLYAMTGVLYGAVTNTPGLGAAQQTFADMHNGDSNSVFAQGYAVAYPLGVVGIIGSIILLRFVFKINLEKEQELYNKNNKNDAKHLKTVSLQVTNDAAIGRTIADMSRLTGREIVITRLIRKNGKQELVHGNTVLESGDMMFLVATPEDIEAYSVLFGCMQEGTAWETWQSDDKNDFISERIVVTNHKLQGKRLGDLALDHAYNVTISRIKRSGVDMLATNSMILQVGDRVRVVGKKENVDQIRQFLGDSVKHLDEPNLMPTFLGIALGVLLGSLPIFLPGMPVPVKLGLAGGPLIVSILLSCYGPKYHLITYSTTSANLLMREIGICLFMATVGLGAGQGFVDTVLNGGYMWVFYGFLITIIPCIVIGIIARLVLKRSYFMIAGMIAGATTDPPALAYSNSICGNDQASVGYSTVYPLSMFLRVLTAQIMVLIA